MNPQELKDCVAALGSIPLALRDALERADWALVAYPTGAILAGPREAMKDLAFQTGPCVVVTTDGQLFRDTENPAE